MPVSAPGAVDHKGIAETVESPDPGARPCPQEGMTMVEHLEAAVSGEERKIAGVPILVRDEHVEYDDFGGEPGDKASDLSGINRRQGHVGEAKSDPSGASAWWPFHEGAGRHREPDQLPKAPANVLVHHADWAA
jgi:hypothetical protein